MKQIEILISCSKLTHTLTTKAVFHKYFLTVFGIKRISRSVNIFRGYINTCTLARHALDVNRIK